MRLSEIKGDRVFDVIADIIEPAFRIAEDKEAMALFDRSQKAPEGMSAEEFALRQIKKAIPQLMRNHSEDLIQILAAIEGVDPEEYRESLTMPKLIQDIYEMLTDEDLISFLS